MVILVDAHRRYDWLLQAVEQRLREALAVLHGTIKKEKSRRIDLARGETFSNYRVRRPHPIALAVR
jgi:hypothetical protein